MNLIICRILENDNSNEEQESGMLYWVFLAPHRVHKSTQRSNTNIPQREYSQILRNFTVVITESADTQFIGLL